MRLATLNEFRSLYFAKGSAPSVRTLKRRIEEIPGGMIFAGRYYVDLDVFEKATRHRQNLEDRVTELKTSPALRGLV